MSLRARTDTTGSTPPSAPGAILALPRPIWARALKAPRPNPPPGGRREISFGLNLTGSDRRRSPGNRLERHLGGSRIPVRTGQRLLDQPVLAGGGGRWPCLRDPLHG